MPSCAPAIVGNLDGSQAKALAGERCNFTGYTGMAQPVGAIWSNFQFENCVRRIQFGKRASNRRILRQDQETFRIVRQAKFFRAAKHSLAFHPAQFADLDLEPSRKHRPRQRQRHLVPRFVIFCPAYDPARLA